MKILIITNLYPPQVLGGYERSIADFARLLQHRGHGVLVLTSDTQELSGSHVSPYPDPEIDRSLLLCGQWHQERGPEWLSPEQIVEINRQNSQTLSRHLQMFQPDVCLLGNATFLQVELLEQVLEAQVPIAHYVMNEQPGYPPPLTPQSPQYRYVTCSDWVTQVLQEKGYPTETAQTIYPGAAVEEFYQTELPPRDQLRIAYASLVMHYKGADVLVEALCLLHAVGIEFTATIAGNTLTPKFVEALQSLIESEGMQDRVTFPGVLSRQELSQLYKTHNVLAFPSRFQEPFGISQVEAMAAGLTLITSGTGGAGEIVEHGQDGLLFESENPFDLADALSFLAANPTEWAAIAQRGQQKALTQFSQTRAVEQLEAVFQALTKERLKAKDKG
ncbi:glycosyltransferase family 4 protein [Kovacikia minuta CCNUW1]|uniref:glycosyltransferase family 4 protein n=1 Tax=Kovacikia minuta TaxID=2931930 RepID=UPI001CC91309|nr:glycosyltransferase family 4 protein [Kovacikia minuta]UBF27738.1 glycosyltransferase family 4 protein [Kovacikia minuta CCNUW1]